MVQLNRTVESHSSVDSITHCWTLSRAASHAPPRPIYVRLIRPCAVKPAAFIVTMLKQPDMTASIDDLSALPMVINGEIMRMRTNGFMLDRSKINAWGKQVACYLTDNSLLVTDKFVQRQSV